MRGVWFNHVIDHMVSFVHTCMINVLYTLVEGYISWTVASMNEDTVEPV